MGTQSWHAGRKGSSWQEKSSKSTMKMTRFGTFLLIAALSSFITAAPQKRAAMDYEAICNSAAAAYSNAKAEGKPTKRAAALSAKIFFDSYVDSGFPAGGLRRCANAVDAAQGQSTNGMVAYFNAASKADIEVLAPVCRVATLAYLKAKIAGKKSSKAKIEASVAYLKAFDVYGDDGFACSKSQKFIPEM